MPTLLDGQAKFIAAIDCGPETLLSDLFAGPRSRVLLGLKAHANTIMHARLVALEASFPRTRGAMGHATFSSSSRHYCECAVARRSSLNHIGAGFPEFLEEADCEPALIDLAEIERAYLESYHASEALALTLAGIGALAPEDLLELRVSPHPAARIIRLRTVPFGLIPELGAVPNGTIIVTRPEADVLLRSLDATESRLFDHAQNGSKIRDLIEIAIHESDEKAGLAPIINLIGVGALLGTG
jgi:hypothetical protein